MQEEKMSSTYAPSDDFEDVGVFEGRPASARTSVFSVRFRADQLSAIEIAAEQRGMSIGEFIRQAALREAAGTDEDTIGLRRLLAEATRAGAHLALIPNAPVKELPLPAGLPEASGG